MTVRSPATPQRAPASAAAAACCQRSSSGTRKVTRCGSRKERQRSSTARSRRSTAWRAGSSAALFSRRARASASHARRSRCAASHDRSKPATSGAARRGSRAPANRYSARDGSICTKLSRRATAANGTCPHRSGKPRGNRGGMLRLPPAGLNLAPHLVGRRLVRTSLVVGFGAVLAACSSRPAGPVAIGLAGPFSQPRGASMLRAAQLAVNQINARHGIRGLPLELRIVDDSGSEDTAVRAAERLYADPTVVAVVGHLSSGPTIAAARVYGAGPNPVAMISPSASSPDLSGVSPWVFRVCPSDLQHGPELARFAWQTLGARRAGIIYLNNDYGRGVRGTFAAEFTRLGGDVVETDPYIPATASLEPYLSRMRRGGADVLLLAAERPGAELALREMRSLGLRWPVLGGDALTGIEADGALAEGMRLSSAYLPDRSDERNVAFVADYARAFPGQRPDHRGAGAYDSMLLLARAIDKVGADRKAIRDYLARVGRGQPPFEGVTGPIVFDGNGDVAGKTVVIGLVRDGRLVTEVAR